MRKSLLFVFGVQKSNSSKVRVRVWSPDMLKGGSLGDIKRISVVALRHASPSKVAPCAGELFRGTHKATWICSKTHPSDKLLVPYASISSYASCRINEGNATWEWPL